MKTIILLLCFSFAVSGTKIYSQDSIRHIRIGIIPYQLLSRGPGIYFAKEGKKYYYELRPSYTIATKHVTYFVPTKHDKYFFQGLNLAFLFQKQSRIRKIPRLMVGCRYWWYNKQSVYAQQATVSTSGSYARMEYKTKWKLGLILDLEVCRQFDFEKLDLSLFVNSGLTLFEGKEFIYNIDEKGHRLESYRRISKVESAEPFVAMGLKIGINKRINPSKTSK